MHQTVSLPDLAQLARSLPLLLGAALLPAGAQAAGPVSVTDVTAVYSQNFDGLASSGTSTWTNGTTLEGWYVFSSGTTAITSYRADDGSASANTTYSYGSAGSSDRALGMLSLATTSPSNFVPIIALAVTNNTGVDIAAFTLSYDGEQWRDGTGGGTPLTTSYRFATSYLNTPGWIDAGSSFNFSTPVTGNSGVALDGNAAANRRAGIGGTVNVTWAAGSTLWLRFLSIPPISTQNGLAIDNLSLSFTPAVTSAVPEPGTWALLAAGLAVIWQKRRRA